MTATDTTLLLPYLVVSATMLGLLIGSFLNVVICRVPSGQSVVTPRSACPACHTTILARDNVPVLSWVLLRGRCRTCATPIPMRYPAVEVGTAALFGLLTWQVGFDGTLPVLLYLAAAGVALALIDLDHFRLPDQIVLPSYPVVLVGLVAAGLLDDAWPWQRTVASAGIWFLLFAIPWFVTAGRGMGYGDVKLAPLLGAALGWLGWGPSLIGLVGGFVLGAAVGAAWMLTGRVHRKGRVAYGPFMLAGALVGVIAGAPMAGAYLRLFGLA